jgi:hypothetical protein
MIWIIVIAMAAVGFGWVNVRRKRKGKFGNYVPD